VPKYTRDEQLAVHPIIDGATGAFDRVVGLVMGDAELVNNIAVFVNVGLLNEAHWHGNGVGNEQGS
jgi:hypothetical protein